MKPYVRELQLQGDWPDSVSDSHTAAIPSRRQHRFSDIPIAGWRADAVQDRLGAGLDSRRFSSQVAILVVSPFVDVGIGSLIRS